jgi:hypothetical protein
MKYNGGAMIDNRQQFQTNNKNDAMPLLVASQFIPSGTILASIPNNKLIILQSDSSLCDLIQTVQDEFHQQQHGESSQYAPFLKWLQTRLGESDNRHQDSLLLVFLPVDLWSKAGQELLQSLLGNYLPPQNIGGHIRWYQSTCLNNKNSGDTSSTLDTKIALWTIQQRIELQLIPWLDLYAHHRSKNNVYLLQESDNIRIVASIDIPASTPLYMDYDVDTPTLLRDYGMVESDLPQFFEFELFDGEEWHSFYFEIKESRHSISMPTVSWPEGRPDSRAAFQALKNELDRLEEMGRESLLLDNSKQHADVPRHEYESIQKYYNVLSKALRVALRDAPPDLSYYSLTDASSFELYNDFDIASHIRGNEGWWEMLRHRKNLMNPSISFYEDKVALKRWLPTYHNVDIPPLIALFYASELPCDAIQSEYYKSILRLLPSNTTTDFVAKPSHKAESCK